jgi:ADP-ribose pyrophosphatase YjhB (NUDIX family)
LEIRQVFAGAAEENPPAAPSYRYCPLCRAALLQKEENGRLRRVCPACGFIQYRNPAAGVSVLIVRDGRVLIGRRGPGGVAAGKWCLPGGFIEYDEDFLTAAKREVLEETGLAVRLRGIVNVASNFLSPALHTLVIALWAEVRHGSPRPGDDLTELQWVERTGPFPDMAFAADRYLIGSFRPDQGTGLPVDGRFA